MLIVYLNNFKDQITYVSYKTVPRKQLQWNLVLTMNLLFDLRQSIGFLFYLYLGW